MLRLVKQLVLSSLLGMGVAELLARSKWRQHRLLILGYHGISLDDEHEWDPGLFITQDQFADRLTFLLRNGYRILPLREALSGLSRGELPAKAVTITFDDGNYDFYAKAFPVLKELGLPATVFLTTYYCEFQRPVFDMISSYLLWKAHGRSLCLNGLDGESEVLDLTTAESREIAHRWIYAFVRMAGLSAEEKDALARSMAERMGIDYDRIIAQRLLSLMTPDEVREVAQYSIDIQLHTHRHRTPLDQSLLVREIQDNRSRIRQYTGRQADHLCYPGGDQDPQIFPWLEQEQVRSAVTSLPGLATREGHPLLIPRLLDNGGMSMVDFASWASGVLELLPKSRLWFEAPERAKMRKRLNQWPLDGRDDSARATPVVRP